MAGTTTYEALESRGNIQRIHISFVADSSDGSFVDADISGVSGYLTNVYVKPGSLTPTTAMDLTVEMVGIDLLAGSGADIVTSANAVITPLDTAENISFPGFMPSLTVTLSNNSVNSAEVEVYLIVAMKS